MALFLATVILLLPTNASAFATVSVLEDSVSKREGDGPLRPITSDTTIGEGGTLETDSTGMAQVDFFDGSVLRLGPSSRYDVETLKDGEDRAIIGSLEYGSAFNRVAELSGQQRYEMRTANAVAAVRGTSFVVKCEGEICEIGVVEGVVKVKSRSTGEEVTLSPGKQLKVSATGNLSPPFPLDLSDTWLALNLDLDEIDVDELGTDLFGPDETPNTDDDPPQVLAETEGDDVPGSGDPGDGGTDGGGTSGGGTSGGGDLNDCTTGYPPRPC